MKTFIIVLTLLSINASADCTTKSSTETTALEKEVTTNTPKFLEGATITVTDKNGKVYTMSADEYMVVPRKHKIATHFVKDKEVTSCSVAEEMNKNRISLLGGYGANNGLERSVSGNIVEVENTRGLVAGLQYQRLIGRTISLGVQAQTNKTGSLLIGKDF